jgi:site-specific DNA recombinase
MTIAAIYARKSTAQATSDDAKSVTRQVERGTACAATKGWTVDPEHVYVDDGISGAEFARRPALLRLVNALKPRPPFQILIMAEESRLGREQIEVAYVLKQLAQAGVRVWLYLEDRERTLDSPTEKLLMSLTAFADEVERDRARQRTRDALDRKARAGHVTGGLVFWYTNHVVAVPGPDGQARRSHVERVVNDAEAATVVRIFEMAASGHGVRAIAIHLNDGGTPAPMPRRTGRSRSWAPSSVHEILRRELYRGVIIWAARRSGIDGGSGASFTTPRPSGSGWRLRRSVS